VGPVIDPDTQPAYQLAAQPAGDHREPSSPQREHDRQKSRLEDPQRKRDEHLVDRTA
jgi:hypothetical protein